MAHPSPNREQSPTFEVHPDGVAWITFDDTTRTVNVLDEAVMLGLGQALDAARAAAREGRARALVIRSGKHDSFIVGADVERIASLEDPVDAEAKIRRGQSIYGDLEALPIPTVAAIHGACVGGGVELALACDHRVLSDSVRTGLHLPEVLLGLLPAWGGTTRLPRLIGLRDALDMLLTGKRVDARRALRIGLADDVVPADLFEEKVRDFALARAAKGTTAPPRPRFRRSLAAALLDTWPGRRLVLRIARKKVLADTGGHYPAPLRILDIVTRNLRAPIERSLAAEAREAAELIVSPVCKNLVHVFNMREAARKADRSAGADVGEVRLLGVLGAGVMGGGIGQLAAYNGVRAYIKDIRHDAVAGGLRHARGLFEESVRRRKMTRLECARHMEMLSGGLAFHGLSAADVVVEAIVEKLEVKRAALRETERHVAADCVLATNTSSLSVDAMAEGLERPERLCGMHFFNPVHRMPLIEVVCGTHTSARTIAVVYRLALRLGKVPVVVRDGPGFLVNRILGPYLNEAGWLLGEGGSIETIDRVAKAFGMPMGPLRLIDEIGVDVSSHAGAALHSALGPRLAPSPALVALAGTGRLGKKGGAGFYAYEKGRERGVDESVYAALDSALAARREIPEREIRDRLVLAMVNEAARALDDRIVDAAEDVDLAMIMGTGFPPFRGGLLRFADTLHPRGLLDAVQALCDTHGPRFAPSPLIGRLAAEDRGFYAAFPRRPVAGTVA